MRLKRSRIKTFYLKKHTVGKTSEGGTYDIYGSTFPILGEAWSAGGKVQAQMYGERLAYIYNMRIIGKYQVVKSNADKVPRYVFEEEGFELQEGDGICLFSSSNDEPDYKIISIKPYHPLKLEVEKI